jgi:hypothetical protein
MEYISGPSVSKLLEMEPGISVENVRSQYLSLGGLNLIQVRNQLPSGRECAGLGVDKASGIALIKALSEYYERKAVLAADESLGFHSTNGVASHRFSLLAKHAAYYELAERDAFLAHWYSRSAFEKVDAIPLNLSVIINALESSQLKTLFYATTLGFEKTIACFIVDKKTGGFALGLSAGRGKFDIEKALQEEIINFELGGYSFSREQLLADYDQNGLTSLQAHRTYWLYKSILPEWVLKGLPCKMLQTSPKLPKTMFALLAQKPFRVVGAKNGAMLPLVVGTPTNSDLTALTQRVKFDSESHGEWLIHPIP